MLTEDDIRNIKYLVYTAGEPYRSMYLQNIPRHRIHSMDEEGGAFYRAWLHTVNYTYEDCFEDDPRGPYTTFFHESGHAIDDLSDKSKWLGSDTENFEAYSEGLGRKVTLRETIEHDVYYNEENPHSVTSMANRIKEKKGSGSGGDVDHVIKAFQSGSSKGLGKEDRKLYQAVKHQYQREAGTGAEYEAVSDVYGGMSGNELRSNWGHPADYWKDKNNAGRELWAEYFSYQMAGNPDSLKQVEEYFPEASKVLDSYADTFR